MIKAVKSPYILPLDLLENSGYGFDESRIKKAINQAQSIGFKEIELPVLEFNSKLFKFINESSIEFGLKPIHKLSAADFVIRENLVDYLQGGVGFKVLIYEPVSPAFLEKIQEIKPHLPLIKFVLIVRKDWNFMSTFKSLPYDIRHNLYVDFPVKLQPRDHFYSYDELLDVVDRMKRNLPGFDLKSLNPHCQLYESLLSGSLVIEDERIDESIKSSALLSVVSSDQKLIEKISTHPRLKKECEIISLVPNDSRPVAEGIVEHQLTLNEESSELDERKTVSLNWVASKAVGQYLYFPTHFNKNEFEQVLSYVNEAQESCESLLNKGVLVVEKDRFIELGGFDPLFSLYSLREFEFVYRYSKTYGSDENSETMSIWRSKIPQSKVGSTTWGAQLFLHRYFDNKAIKGLLPWRSQANRSKVTARKPFISPRQVYIFIRFRDAYLSLFEWTPLVIIEGNIVILFSFLKRGTIRSFEVIKKTYFHEKIFRLFAPLRKVYYFTRFQYRKRILKENPNE